MLVVSATIEVYPLRDVVLPPFTSKVTRTAFAALWGEEPLLGRLGSFSVLFREGKPLYKRADVAEVLAARARERLEARVSFLTHGNPSLPEDSSCFVFGGSEFNARVTGIEVVTIENLRVDLPRKFSLRFLTPTLLPVPGRGELLRERGVKRRYRLLPDLPLALRLLTYDLKLRKINLVKATPFQVYKWAYRALAELDYNVKPETVLYTVKGGKPSTERGFTGFVLYELLDEASPLKQELEKLIAFALRFGIGKSRSIGFGQIALQPIHEQK
jgi:CRISPR-associated endoribonuclease Cas6